MRILPYLKNLLVLGFYIFEWNLKKWTQINEITLYGELYMQIFEIAQFQTMRIKNFIRVIIETHKSFYSLQNQTKTFPNAPENV